jgi:hypothetical protein
MSTRSKLTYLDDNYRRALTRFSARLLIRTVGAYVSTPLDGLHRAWPGLSEDMETGGDK